MVASRIMTAQDFAAGKFDLPEGGRWHELHFGKPQMMSAPDDLHGVIVLNLSRALAQWLASRRAQKTCYAVHDVGLHVQRDPDTVLVPAMSVFTSGLPFSQSDMVVASEVPALVIDVASSNDRRREMRLRTTACLALGVNTIWIPDPFKKEVQVIRRGAHTLALGKWQTLDGGSVLPDFTMPVEKVFAQPEWWTGKVKHE